MPAPIAHVSATGFHAEDVTVAAADGQPLVATLWLPDSPGRHPAVLLPHGFGLTRSSMRATAERYAALDFVALAWDARGFGASGGYIELNGPKEVSDVRQIITYLAGRPEVQLDAAGDPRIAMRGDCYGGAIQLLAAAQDDRLDALVPITTWTNLSWSLNPNQVVKVGWVTLFFASGTGSGHGIHYSNPQEFEPNGNGFEPAIDRYFVEIMATNKVTPEIQAYLDARSPDRVLASVRAPTFLVQGWPDTLFVTNEASSTFNALTARGVPAKMLFYGGGHGYEGAADPGALEYREQRIDGWLRFWLRGEGDPIDLFRTPVEWAEGTSTRFLPEQSWPPADGQPRDFYLTVDAAGRGRLAPKAPTADARALLGAGGLTSYSEIPNFQSQLPTQSAEAPATSFSYTSDPFAEPTMVLGAPTLRFQASTTADEATLFVKVYDDAPGGASRLLDNHVTPVRIGGPDPGLAAPREYALELVSLRHLFLPGHQVRLTVATSDDAHGSGRTPGAVALDHRAARPTRLELPVQPADRASDATPPLIDAVHATRETILARITDARGVAATHLYYLGADGWGVVGGIAGPNGTYAFTPRLQGPSEIHYRLAATDAAGNQALTDPHSVVMGGSEPAVQESPAPAAALVLLALLIPLVFWRRGRPIPGGFCPPQ